ncbi:hypothetical protein HF521_020105 [Silurus meridionalis]|uniref:Aquaporin 1a (Colton blood group), tandem duplicate 1 n=2 Tax=Silurus meridionalis TaxID=175797 RepID=A0A8T0BI34_SILME|nr:hypothetical protein HF521_020105 [Silurus meridionalis]
MLGMTLFIFLSIAAAVGNVNNKNPDQEVKVALAFGLSIATLAQSLGHISGAHLNPAVTVGLLVSCQISAIRAFFYILAQMFGSVLASSMVLMVRPQNITSLGVNQLNGIEGYQGVVVEMFGTFQLVLCVLAVTDKRRRDVAGSIPLAIGLSVALGHLMAISFTGCGINPARSFGPAILSIKDNGLENHWVYWVGPMCGGVAAAFVYDFLLYPKTESFPERMRVLVSGPPTDYDVNGRDDVPALEMSSK